MKKIFSIILLLLVVGVNAFAKKSYVTVWAQLNSSSTTAILSGNVPDSMKLEYKAADFSLSSAPASKWIGNVLNLLANEDFVVEQMNTVSASYQTNGILTNREYIIYLLSKNEDSPSPVSDVQKVKSDNDEEDTEVARYNLQGLPVDENEKGIQIIVYSNYTTKTVINE